MIFLMAWRNIWRNKLRSSVIMVSIALGLFAGIAVLALYKGMMRSRVKTVIYEEVGHLQLHDPYFKTDYEPQYIIKNGPALLKNIKQLTGVKIAAARSLTNGMLATTTGSAGVQINGIDPPSEYIVSQLNSKIREGRIFDPAKRNEVMVGRKLANKMKLKTGSKLVLTFTDTSGSIVSGAFRVAAIYESKNAPLDERNVYVDINTLNELLGTKNCFHEIVVLLKQDEQVSALQQKMQSLFKDYKIESWKEISPETDLMIKTTDNLSYILITIIMFALAFGIINTMLMAILERTREIGMMMALGTGKKRIFILVLFETILLTLTGTPAGLMLGWFVINHYNKHGLDFGQMGKEMMSSFGYSNIIYPEFPADKIAGVLLIVCGTAIISCLFPAVKAINLLPVEALKR